MVNVCGNHSEMKRGDVFCTTLYIEWTPAVLPTTKKVMVATGNKDDDFVAVCLESDVSVAGAASRRLFLMTSSSPRAMFRPNSPISVPRD